MGRITTAAAIALLFLSVSSSGTVIHVDWAGGGDYVTILEGISAASGGDTVLVSCGTYCEHDVEIKPGIHLTSETGFPDCVTVDAEGLGRVFSSGSEVDTTASIAGITITGGHIEGENQEIVRGGGMSCVDSPSLVRCVFAGNTVVGYVAMGGGLYCRGMAKATDCVFSGNTARSTQSPIMIPAPEGGGARVEGVSLMSDCRFHGNRAWHDGGGLVCMKGTVTRCAFTDNEAYRDAGGVYCEADFDTAWTFTDCTFSGNHAGRLGGAALCYSGGWVPSLPAFEGCTFSQNVANSALGGAIWSDCYSLDVDGCTLVLNYGTAAATLWSDLQIQNTIVAFTESGAPLSGSDVEITQHFPGLRPRREELESDVSLEPRVLGPSPDALAAFADLLDGSVVRDSRAEHCSVPWQGIRC